MAEAYLQIFQNIIETNIWHLRNQAQEMSENGEDVLKNNSYSNSSTGYNTVEDYEFTPEYNAIQNKIEQLEELQTQTNDTYVN